MYSVVFFKHFTKKKVFGGPYISNVVQSNNFRQAFEQCYLHT